MGAGFRISGSKWDRFVTTLMASRDETGLNQRILSDPCTIFSPSSTAPFTPIP